MPARAQPIPNSYWVVPQRLLAGEHPNGAGEAETRGRLERLRDAGIDMFVDLTAPDECTDYQQLLPSGTAYLRSAIPDMDTPEEHRQIHELQARIRGALLLDRNVYVHCRAGIGRTGLVIGCFLADEGLDGKRALKQLNRLWKQSARSKSWPKVPQTPEQAAYILDWPAYRKSTLSQRIDS